MSKEKKIKENKRKGNKRKGVVTEIKGGLGKIKSKSIFFTFCVGSEDGSLKVGDQVNFEVISSESRIDCVSSGSVVKKVN